MQIQTSTAGIPITLLWGTNKLACNLFWMANFQAHKSKGGKGGKGGGGKGGGGTTTYTASVEMGLCEGPIQQVSRVFSNNSVTYLGALLLGLLDGSDGAGPGLDGMLNKHLAYVYSSYFDLGAAATLPALNFEVAGNLTGSVPSTSDGYDRSHDANFADIIWDFIGNHRYGMDPDLNAYIDMDSWNGYKTYCQAQSLVGSPMLDNQDQALTTLQRWATMTNTWIFWSGTALKFVPLATEPVTDGNVTYHPLLTPIVDLNYDDYVFDSTSRDSDPITFERIDPRDGYNRVEVDCLDRNNYYDANPQYWEDLASIQDFGLLQSQVIDANDICDPNVGQIIARLVGERVTSIRNTYSFKLGYSYILLEPGDIVTLSEPNLGLSRLAVRITEISEDDKGNLDIKAEEFPFAIDGAMYRDAASTTSIPNQPSSTFDPGIDQYADPGNVNQPMIIEPPASVTGGPPEIWIGASGGSSWGGAVVYLSIDGLNYANTGNITASTAQGISTIAIPLGTVDPDTTHTINVDMSISGMDLPTGITHSDADQGTTASLIDDEVLSWGTVTPTGSMTYNLTYLRRGIYSSPNEAHVAGAIFSRIDPGVVVKFSLPLQWVGRPIHVKLTSFNTFNLMTQDISTVVDYIYTPAGVAYQIAPPTAAGLTAGMVTQSDGTNLLFMNTTWTGSVGPSLGSYEVQMSADGGSTWTASDITVGPSVNNFRFSPAVPSVNYQSRIRALTQNGLGASTWAMSPIVNSGSIGSHLTVPATPTGLSASPGTNQVALNWFANAPGDTVISYKIYKATGLSQPVGSSALLATVSAGTLGYNDTGLANGSQWTYFISAVNSAGESGRTAGVNATVTTPIYQTKFSPYYSLQARKPNANEVLFSLPISYNVQFPSNLAGSRGNIDGIAATATVNFSVRQNGTNVGTITYPSGSTGRNLATFSTVGAAVLNFVAGDELSVVAGASPDLTFQGFSFSLEGLR
jgi:hypothetical protein